MKQSKKLARLSGVAAASLLGMCFIQAQATEPPYQTYTPDLLPPNPVAGECYTRVKIEPGRQTSTQRVIMEDGYSTLEVTPPQFVTRQENIMVKEPSVEYRVRQPRYETVREDIMVRPGYEKLIVTPPQFETISQSLLMSPPRRVWKKGNPAKLRAQGYKIHATADSRYADARTIGTLNAMATPGGISTCGETCEIWCLVEEPGVTADFRRRVLKSESRVQSVPVEPKYKSIVKEVLADPGGVEEIPIPARYEGVTFEDIVGGGEQRRVDVPPTYGEVTAQVPTGSERYEWRRVVCKPGTIGYVAPATQPMTQVQPRQYVAPQTSSRVITSQPMQRQSSDGFYYSAPFTNGQTQAPVQTYTPPQPATRTYQGNDGYYYSAPFANGQTQAPVQTYRPVQPTMRSSNSGDGFYYSDPYGRETQPAVNTYPQRR